MRRDHTFALSEKENNLLRYFFCSACIPFPKMQPRVHYIQSSSCFTQEQLPWAFSSTMQKPYGVQGAGDKPNLSLSARPGAECSFRNVTAKNWLGIDAVWVASSFWQPKKRAVCNDENWNKPTLLEKKSSVSSLPEWSCEWLRLQCPVGAPGTDRQAKGHECITCTHTGWGHTAHPGTYTEKEIKQTEHGSIVPQTFRLCVLFEVHLLQWAAEDFVTLSTKRGLFFL